MAPRKITTIRLDPEDQRALVRARRDGVAASELIRRGLRVVAGRYYEGRGEGALAGADPETPSLRAWQREREAFGRLTARTLEPHRGRWVAVLGGRVVASHDDLDALSRRARALSRGRPFFVGRADSEPEVVEMSGFEIA